MQRSPVTPRRSVARLVALIGLEDATRRTAVALIGRAIGTRAVAVYGSLEDAQELDRSAVPRLAIVDADALGPRLRAELQAARRLFPACHLIALGTATTGAGLHAAMQSGADTYLSKRYTETQTMLVLKLAWEGAGHWPRLEMQASQPQGATRRPEAPRAQPVEHAATARNLTPKQNEVLAYLAAGKSNRDIGRMLGIKEGTVKLHVTEILRKLEVDTRGQAMLLAHRLQQVQRHMVDQGQDGSLVLDGLMSHAVHRQYRPGDVIFRKGDRGGELYYVQRGTVQLDEIGEDMGPGDIFGEIGVFSPERARTSTARCKTDVDLFCVDAERAKVLYFDHPHFALRIATLLAQRLVAERAEPPRPGAASSPAA